MLFFLNMIKNIFFKFVQLSKTIIIHIVYDQSLQFIFLKVLHFFNTIQYYISVFSECGKIRTRKTANTYTFHAVKIWNWQNINSKSISHVMAFAYSLDSNKHPESNLIVSRTSFLIDQFCRPIQNMFSAR